MPKGKKKGKKKASEDEEDEEEEGEEKEEEEVIEEVPEEVLEEPPPVEEEEEPTEVEEELTTSQLCACVHLLSGETFDFLDHPVRPRPDIPKKELLIDEDAELSSALRDRVEELQADHATYLRHHPELRQMLQDFLQETLTRKPEKFIHFGRTYFSSFRHVRPARPVQTEEAPSPICECEEPEAEDEYDYFPVVKKPTNDLYVLTTYTT